MSDPEIERIMQQKLRKMINEAANPPAPAITDLDGASFDTAITGDLPIIVDFWAQWCGPCKSMHPAVKAVASELAGKVRVGRADIDAVPDIAQRFGVQSVPTFILFFKGAEVRRAIGAIGANGLRKLAGFAP